MSTIVSNREDVIARIRALTPRLHELGVKRLALFGSFARGTQQADSDIDLLAEFAPGRKTFDNFFAVCELLEEALERRVDVLTPEALSPHIGPHILREAEDVVLAH